MSLRRIDVKLLLKFTALRKMASKQNNNDKNVIRATFRYDVQKFCHYCILESCELTLRVRFTTPVLTVEKIIIYF